MEKVRGLRYPSKPITRLILPTSSLLPESLREVRSSRRIFARKISAGMPIGRILEVGGDNGPILYFLGRL